MKKMNLTAGVLSLSGIVMLSGCAGDRHIVSQSDYLSDQSIYRTVEKAERLIKDDKLKCVALFTHPRDKIGINAGMLHFQIKPGARIRLPFNTEPELVYTAKGSGMISIDGVAFILHEGSGVYIPPRAVVEIVNNSGAELNLMMISRDIPAKKGLEATSTLAFEAPARTEKILETPGQVTAEEIISTAPGKLTPGDKAIQSLGTQEKKPGIAPAQ